MPRCAILRALFAGLIGMVGLAHATVTSDEIVTCRSTATDASCCTESIGKGAPKSEAARTRVESLLRGEPGNARAFADAGTTCVLSSSGEARCEGERSQPAPSREKFLTVAVGETHACGLLVGSRRARCWRLALASNDLPPPPLDPPLVDVAVGSHFACGIRESDGRIECWSDRSVGPDLQESITARSARAVKLAIGLRSVCGLYDDGRVWCFGSWNPLTAAVPHVRAKDLVVSGSHGCMRTEDDRLRCWGGPAEAIPPRGTPWPGELWLSAGSTCGVFDGDRVECWGGATCLAGDGRKSAMPSAKGPTGDAPFE